MGWIMYPAIASLAMMTAVSVPVTTSVQESAPELSEAEILKMEIERYQRLTVPVTIGEHGPFDFMIDTGAQATVLSDKLADRLGIVDRRPATLIGMASRKAIEVVSVEDFNLGSRSFNIQMAPLVEAANIGGADGILGIDSLQRQRVLLDFTKNTISVADAEAQGGNNGFEIVVKARRKLGQLIIARATIDDTPVAVIIDTGAQGSVGNMALHRRLRHRGDLGTTELTDVNGEQLEGNVRVARSLRIDRVQIHNFPVTYADAPPFEALGLGDEPALILGMRELKVFRRVAIDFSTQRILFDLPRDAREFDSMYGRRIGV